MNHPTGFSLQNGKVTDVHPWSALFGNTYLWHELVHMYLAGYMVCGFLVAGAYAFGRLRGRWGRYERTALVIPLTIAALAAPVQVLVGDWAGRAVADKQPVKLAALEGLGHTQRGAPLHVLGWYSDDEVKYGIGVPKMLSFLAFHDFDARVDGLDTVPPDQRPPVNVVRIAFQTMVGIGTLLALLGTGYAVMRVRRRALPESRWFYRAVVAAGPLALLALICGWIVTEVGRQPWVVYRVMRTSEAVTGAGGVPVGYATLLVVYAGVAVATWWILRRLARAPLDLPAEAR
jgi:cytochrome d ubiquinol oxidase subunit I